MVGVRYLSISNRNLAELIHLYPTLIYLIVEPDLFTKDIPVPPEQLSNDFRALFALLKKTNMKSLIAGPDVSNATNGYLEKYKCMHDL